METVTQYTSMKSGDKFICNDGPKVMYTLQKFPNFNLWMLISEHNAMFKKPMDTPIGAFGGSYFKFSKTIPLELNENQCRDCFPEMIYCESC